MIKIQIFKKNGRDESEMHWSLIINYNNNMFLYREEKREVENI